MDVAGLATWRDAALSPLAVGALWVGLQQWTGQAMRTVAAPVIWLHSGAHGLIRALDVLDWR